MIVKQYYSNSFLILLGYYFASVSILNNINGGAMKLRRANCFVANTKTTRTPITSALCADYTTLVRSCVPARIYTHADTCARVLHNLRGGYAARTLSALIPSACSLVTILSFSCVINKKRFITDSNCSKKEALLKGVMR